MSIDTEVLDPEIALAIENWVEALMKERQGQGRDTPLVIKSGTVARVVRERSWQMREVWVEIYRVAPDAIARMLQAGAANYIGGKDPLDLQ